MGDHMDDQFAKFLCFDESVLFVPVFQEIPMPLYSILVMRIKVEAIDDVQDHWKIIFCTELEIHMP